MPKSDLLYESGTPINIGTHGDHDYVFAEGKPVPDSGKSSYIFESGIGLGETIDEWFCNAHGLTGHCQCKTALPTSDPTVQWTATPASGEDVYSNLVVDETHLYGQTWGSTVFKLRRDDGTVEWTYDAHKDYREPRTTGCLNRKRGHFYLTYTYYSDTVVAYNTDGSGIDWTYDVTTSPSTGANIAPYDLVATDDYVFVFCGTGTSDAGDTLYCLDAADGTVVWYHDPSTDQTAVRPSLAPAEGLLCWGATDLFKNTIDDGTNTETLSHTELSHGHLTVDYPYVYMHGGVGNTELTKVDLESMSIVWNKNALGFESRIGPTLDTDTGEIYLGGDAGKMAKFDPDGTRIWRVDNGGRISTPMALSRDGDMLVIAPGAIKGVNPSDGSIAWVYGDDTGESVKANDPICYGNGGIYFNGPSSTSEISFLK